MPAGSKSPLKVLPTAIFHRPPLKGLLSAFFDLLTRKWVYVFFYGHLLTDYIFL